MPETHGQVRVSGEAAEVASAEAQAVLAMVQDEDAARCGSPTSSPRSPTARSRARTPTRSRELLELGLQTGRIRVVYGPEGEQAALALYRRLPLGRELDRVDARAERGAAGARGPDDRARGGHALGPGEYGVTLSTDDYELVLRLGKAGARLATIGA